MRTGDRIDIEDIAWPTRELGICLPALFRESGWKTDARLRSPDPWIADQDLRAWVTEAAPHLGGEVDFPEASYRSLADDLQNSGPGLLGCGTGKWFAIVRCRRGRVTLLGPDLQTRNVALWRLCGAVRQHAEDPHRASVGAVLDHAGLSGAERDEAAELLLQDRLDDHSFGRYFAFVPPPALSSLEWLRACRVPQRILALGSAYGIQYLLWFASWALFGTLSFRGHLDQDWLAGWALCLLTVIPFRVVATWWGGLIPIVVGGQLKRRLLDGALRLKPDEVKEHGIGSFLAQVFEAEALEQLALNGGLMGLLALIDLTVAAFVLGRLAWLLLLWIVLTGWCGYRFFGYFDTWSGKRMQMTHALVEGMVGHRTRLAQGDPAEWSREEDNALDGYAQASVHVDAAGSHLVALIPRGWLLTSLLCLTPAIAAGQLSGAVIAVQLGGVLLAFAAFGRLSEAVAQTAPAAVAWRRVAPLFAASERLENLGDAQAAGAEEHPETLPVVECSGVRFSYPNNGKMILNGGSLTVRRGEHVLVEGPSGAGKSTLASLLSGLRQPQAGLVLASGLDGQTTGRAGWLRRILSVPQFHENHIFTESLAFNLLLGRGTPHGPRDLDDAETACRGLGLGELLDRMPGGLLEMVGEGGWQLSHGERSRVFLARALLQKCRLLILDETFGALDPQTLDVALTYTRRHTETLLLLAHP